jgi:DNA-binding MarR family transcriptional regulator
MISRVGALYHGIQKECSRVLKEREVPFEMDQIPVILMLYYRKGASQQEISLSLQRDKASVNRTVSFLLKKDIVKVHRDAANKRKTRVELTAAGEKLAAQANTAIEEVDAFLSSALTEKEKEQFYTIIPKLIERITST